MTPGSGPTTPTGNSQPLFPGIDHPSLSQKSPGADSNMNGDMSDSSLDASHDASMETEDERHYSYPQEGVVTVQPTEVA